MMGLSKKSVLGSLFIAFVLCATYGFFNEIFRIIPFPEHQSYDAFLAEVQKKSPDKEVQLEMISAQELDLYARYTHEEDYVQTLQRNNTQFLYQWKVQIKAPGSEHVTNEYYRLDGKPLGFIKVVLDKDFYPSVSKKDAKDMALSELAKHGITVADWTQQAYKEKQVRQRKDHRFLFEKTNAFIGQAHEVIEINITGDQVSAFEHYVKIPDDFSFKLKQIRKNNELLGALGAFGMMALLAIGGIWALCLLRRKGAYWQGAFIFTGLAVFASVTMSLNNGLLQIAAFAYYFPDMLKWGLLFKNALMSGCALGVYFLLPALGGLTLYQQAFPERPSFSSWWRLKGYQNPFARRIIYIAYFSLLGFILYEMIYYYLTQTFFGFFLPPVIGYDLNYQAAWIGGINPVLGAIIPGFSEELIFRVLPLGILLYYRPNPKTYQWYLLVFLQAFFFAAAHATYPAEPFYARLFELLIPAIAFAFLIRYVDMMAAFLTHTLYDAVWFGLIYFNTPVTWETFVFAFLFFLPLLLCAWGAFRQQVVVRTNEQEYVGLINYDFYVPFKHVRHPKVWLIVLLVSSLILAVGLATRPVVHAKITPHESAITQSKQFWLGQGYEDAQEWLYAPRPDSVNETLWYTSQMFFKDHWEQLVPKFLPVGCQRVTAVGLDPKWSGYTFETGVCGDQVLSFQVQMPYDAKKVSSNQPEALALAEINRVMGQGLMTKLRLNSVEKLPQRTVHRFIFDLPRYDEVVVSADEDIKLSVYSTVTGNQVVDMQPMLELKQERSRQYQVRDAWMSLFDFSNALMVAFILGLLVILLRFPHVSWRSRIGGCVFWPTAVLGLGVIWGELGYLRVYLLSSGASGLLSHMYEFASLLGMFLVAYLFMQVFGAFHHLIQAQRRTLNSNLLLGLAVGSLLSALQLGVHDALDPFVPYQLLINQSDWLMRHLPATDVPFQALSQLVYVLLTLLLVHLLYGFSGRAFAYVMGLMGLIGAIGGVGWFVSMPYMLAIALLGFATFFTLASLMQYGFLALAAACFVIFLWKLIFASLTVMAWVVALMAIAYLFMINQHLTDFDQR